MNSRLFTFVGGDSGPWRITRMDAVVGANLDFAKRLSIANIDMDSSPAGARWRMRGVTSNERYVTLKERALLVDAQPQLGRPEATCAALIPMTKSARWWALTQEERRAILEEKSAHIATGLKYLPAIARKLHHGRDLGEPFDFITWFEYAPSQAQAFEELVATLRATEEWTFVERELDIRLVRDDLLTI